MPGGRALVFVVQKAWQSGVDEAGEIGRGVGGFRGGVDERARFQLAIEQDAPVPRGTLRADARRAVGRRGVVSARMRVKFIQGAM